MIAAAEKRDIERAGVRGPVCADEAGAVDGEAHWKRLQRDIVDDLIVAALQEGRIDCAERLEAFGGEARGEGHRVLLGDADVERAFREGVAENVEPGAVRHRGGHSDDEFVLGGFLDQTFAKHLGEGGRAGLRLVLGSGRDIEAGNRVMFVARGLGRGVALALFRDHMDQYRPGVGIARRAQHGHELAEIMAVDRPDVGKSQILEPGPGGRNIARGRVRGLGSEAGEIVGQRADRRRDRHLIVVENDDQSVFRRAGIVDGLVGHARRHRAVADHGDDIMGLAPQVPRYRHAQRG